MRERVCTAALGTIGSEVALYDPKSDEDFGLFLIPPGTFYLSTFLQEEEVASWESFTLAYTNVQQTVPVFC